MATVLRNAARLASLVDNLLYLDHDRSSQETPQRREPTDVAALVVEARHDVEQEAGDRELGIDVHVPDGPAVVLGDPAELRRLVWNLADNAIKFTPDGGSITVEVTSTPAGTVLTVADTGIGMSEEDRQRVRARFYRSSEVYRLAVPGAGLGLSVVDTIVAAHGGTMDIVSEHGRGTTVTVTLPPYGRGGPTG